MADAGDASEALDQEALLRAALDRKVRRARLVLLIDRVWPLAWGPVFVAGTFILVSMFGLWPLLPLKAHAALLLLFGLAFLASVVRLARLRRPTRVEALRRLETVGGLRHRPASTYEDHLSAELDTPDARLLWATHRRRMAAVFDRLSPGWPCPRVDLVDPFALRGALILLLAVSFSVYGNSARERLASSLDLRDLSGGGNGARIDVWLTPPVYTGKPPLMLIDASQPTTAGRVGDGAIETAERSELTIRVNDVRPEDYELRILSRDGDGERKVAPSRPAGEGSGGAAAVPSGGSVEFRETISSVVVAELTHRGDIIANWRIRVIADRVPAISSVEQPAQMQRGSLRFHYKVEDDYGVAAAQAVFERAGAPGGETLVVPLSLPRSNLKSGEGQTYKDLTAHPWAGLPVSVVLTARDQAGQTGKTEPVTFALPERQFTKPLARAVIEQRRTLVERPDLREAVAKALDALTVEPETSSMDRIVYLGLRTAHWRLLDNPGGSADASVIDQLWQVALRIEDGDLSSAERDLRAAQDKLMKALEENAPPEQIRALVDELRSALNRFLESAAHNARNKEELNPRAPGAEQVTARELNDVLSKIESLANTGSRDMARQVLSQLRDLLENVDAGNQQQSPQSERMMKALDGLSDLIGKQQKLLDETFRSQQRQEDETPEGGQTPMLGERGGPEGQGQGGKDGGKDGPQRPGGQRGHAARGAPQQGGGGMRGLQKDQEGLSQTLDKLLDEIQGLGVPPPPQLKDAQRGMSEAGRALGDDNAGQAVEQETLALERLRKGAQSLVEQMMEGGGKMQAGRGGRNPKDPFGRPQRTQNSSDPGDSTKVIHEDVQRAREIFDELKHRLGEPSRPSQELDYIERLIRRF